MESASDSSVVTDVISSIIKPGNERNFDEWFKRYLDRQKKAPGYLATTILAPQGNDSTLRYVITRFKNNDSLEDWKKSAERIKLIEEVNAYSTPHYERATGLETWFALPGVPIPPRWKMSIVTFIGAYIIAAITFTVLRPIIEIVPFLVINVVITFILVVGLTYFALPGLTRLFRRWLYPKV
jgi:uncharacterized protein